MVENYKLSYNDQGKGPVVVLLHGFCESKTIWKKFEEKLANNYRVISPDLPGFGDSLQSEGEASIEFYAAHIFKFLTELKVEKCILIGHSLGGYIALAFAEMHENMLDGLGMFHSSAFADTEEKKASRNKTIDFVNKHGSAAFANSFVAPLFSINNRERNSAEINFMTDVVSNTKKESIVFASKAMRDRKERLDVLKNVKVRILFIVGKEDTAVPLEKSLEQCYLAKESHVNFLANTSHMGMFEKKVETLGIIKYFIDLCENKLKIPEAK